MEPSSSSDPFNVHNSRRPHRQNDVRYTDFVVSVVDSDYYFIFQLPRSLRGDDESSTVQSSSTRSCSISYDRLNSGPPNFSFLGELHGKLRELNNSSLSNYITHFQQQSEDIMPQVHGNNNGDLLRTDDQREMVKLFSMFFSAVRPDII